MKVIDLLNKIANNEEVPKKIKFDDNIYKLQSPKCYMCEKSDKVFEEDFIFEDLNKEVEVIEDNKIEKLDMKEMKEDSHSTQNEIMLGYKINEIIDFIKENE